MESKRKLLAVTRPVSLSRGYRPGTCPVSVHTCSASDTIKLSPFVQWHFHRCDGCQLKNVPNCALRPGRSASPFGALVIGLGRLPSLIPAVASLGKSSSETGKQEEVECSGQGVEMQGTGRLVCSSQLSTLSSQLWLPVTYCSQHFTYSPYI